MNAIKLISGLCSKKQDPVFGDKYVKNGITQEFGITNNYKGEISWKIIKICM